jgi:hypothetical protein
MLLIASALPAVGNMNGYKISEEKNLGYKNFSTSKQVVVLQPEFVVGPYTQNVTNTSITILWETDIPTTNNSVEYGETSGYGYVEYGASDTDHHEITIHPAFTAGHYKVVSDSVESGDFEFKLASHCYSTQEFKCVVYGDSRGVWDNWSMATQVANAVNVENPDFVMHSGDMVYDGLNEWEWTSWLNLMKPLMQNSTVFGVLGNHENNGPRYFEIFALPNNEKWYSFDYGPCHFIGLSNYHPWNVGSEQYDWLENDLSSTSQPFKIVCFHEPIYCAGGHSPRVDVREAWEPLFIDYGVQLVVQGHNHYYQRTNPINGITYIVTGGAGGPLYPPGTAPYVNNSWMVYHYCVLDVSLETMEIIFSAKFIHGGTFDEFVINIPDLSFEITGGLGVKAVITNNGDSTAVGVDVEIHVEGGILGMIDKTVTDTIDIPAGGTEKVSTGLLLGVGGINIMAKVSDEEKIAEGFQVLIFSIINNKTS